MTADLVLPPVRAVGPAAAPVMLAAGGTGGHLFPAEALARELLARSQPVVLVTDRRGPAFGRMLPAPSEPIAAVTRPAATAAALPPDDPTMFDGLDSGPGPLPFVAKTVKT